MNLSIDELKNRVPLRTVLSNYGFADLPERSGKHFTCFFPERHAGGDQNPSCNFYSGAGGHEHFKCFSCGAGGDQFDFVEQWEGVNTAEAKKIICSIGGLDGGNQSFQAKRRQQPTFKAPENRVDEQEPIIWPNDLHSGSLNDWQAVADLRNLDVQSVNLATVSGVLKFGTVHGLPCWIVTDKSKLSAEARTISGENFSHGAKVHTLKNSQKSWPVGIALKHSTPELFSKIALVEGSADLLAAYHFNHVLLKMDYLPVAILGKENKKIHPEALKLFKGRHVRIFPHNDADGGGVEAGQRWAEQVHEAGAESIDGFDFSNLARIDGKPVSDLNDCTILCENDQNQIEQLLA